MWGALNKTKRLFLLLPWSKCIVSFSNRTCVHQHLAKFLQEFGRQWGSRTVRAGSPCASWFVKDFGSRFSGRSFQWSLWLEFLLRFVHWSEHCCRLKGNLRAPVPSASTRALKKKFLCELTVDAKTNSTYITPGTPTISRVKTWHPIDSQPS